MTTPRSTQASAAARITGAIPGVEPAREAGARHKVEQRDVLVGPGVVLRQVRVEVDHRHVTSIDHRTTTHRHGGPSGLMRTVPAGGAVGCPAGACGSGR